MSETVQGIVSKAKEVEHGSSARGPWSKRSIEVNGVWYGGFLNKDNKEAIEAIQVGDEVVVSYAVNGKYKNFSSVKVVTPAVTPSAPAAAPNTTATVSKPDNYQYRITYAGARNSALKLIELALAAEGVKLPAGKEKRLQALEALTEELTEKLATANWNAQPRVEGFEDLEDDSDFED